ncbi:MAG: hypothetical protein Q9227_007792 [Pyrenula ochraceoflavens]
MAPELMTIPPEVRHLILEELLVQYPRFRDKPPTSKTDDPRKIKNQEEEIDSSDRTLLSRLEVSTRETYDDSESMAIRCTYPWITETNTTRCSAQILRTCKTVYAEGQRMLYGNNVFDMTAYCKSSHWFRNRYDVQSPIHSPETSFLTRIGNLNWNTVQHINIEPELVVGERQYIDILDDKFSEFDFWGYGDFLAALDNDRVSKSPNQLQTLQTWLPCPSSRHLPHRDYQSSSMELFINLTVLGILQTSLFGATVIPPNIYKKNTDTEVRVILIKGRVPETVSAIWEKIDVSTLLQKFEGEIRDVNSGGDKIYRVKPKNGGYRYETDPAIYDCRSENVYRDSDEDGEDHEDGEEHESETRK